VFSIKRQKNECQTKIADRFASSRAPPRYSLIDHFATVYSFRLEFSQSPKPTPKRKRKKIHYTYISKRKEFLASYGAIAVIAIYNLIRNRLISPIIIRARFELDLIKSCVSNTKDQFVKKHLRRFTYVLLCISIYISIYVYIYNIFSLIHIYIFQILRNFILSLLSTLTLVFSYGLIILNSSSCFFFFLLFFSKLFIFDGRHANLRVSYDNFIIDSLLFLETFCSFYFIITSWYICIYNIYISLSVCDSLWSIIVVASRMISRGRSASLSLSSPWIPRYNESLGRL